MNHLINEKSPYLLQHSENPVNWYPWGEEAFARAKEEDRPVFLSIGYSTCHWCHVMAHESFEDAEVAYFLNQNFISVKVDREERPEIDAVYMAACQTVTGSGGWPLTAVLTPEQKPFFVGTYFPKYARYGQPGLLEILHGVLALWKDQRDRVLLVGRQLAEAVAAEGEQKFCGEPDQKLFHRAAEWFRQNYDRVYGGFGEAPKFPVPHNLCFLMRYAAAADDAGSRSMAEHTLRAMAAGGIFDQIGGGFSRYSTDTFWLVPHFEKMLYDNALLAIAYLEAYQMTDDRKYADTARRTLSYILRELTAPAGGFYCGQDADSEGEEGKYYCFMPKEICEVLGEEAGEAFCAAYDITEQGNFEGKSIPNRLSLRSRDTQPEKQSGTDRRNQNRTGEPDEEQKSIWWNKLYEYRKSRTSIHLDDKIILSWNALSIMAFAKAARILGEKRYLDAAVRAYDFIAGEMTGAGGRLFVRWREGEAAHKGPLDDYAFFGLALLALYHATFRPQYLREAAVCAEQIVNYFTDKKNGGCFLTASDAERLIARRKETYDGALPSGNAAAALLFARLAQYTGEVRWQKCSDEQNRFLAGIMQYSPYGHSLGLIALMEGFYSSGHLICTGSAIKPPEELIRYLKCHPAFFLSVIYKNPQNAAELAEVAPITEAYPVPEEGFLYYLCRNGACAPPETEFDRLCLPEL